MFKNFLWDFGGKFTGQIVSFIISISLTRLLSPEEFGIMGMALVVITFATMFLDLGFSRALIQQTEVSPVQYSTVFYINFTIAIILTLCCFLLAAPLAAFYKQPLVRPVFEVLSLNFLFNGLNLIPSSILYKRMKFKVITIFTVTSSTFSGIVGVILALNHFGIWSLVVQTLLNSLLNFILNFFYVRWLPLLKISFKSVKPLWKFGSRLFAAGFLDVLYSRADVFIIGKIFSPATLGYYTRAQSLDVQVKNISSGSIMSVLFPFIAKNQNDKILLKELYIKYFHYILFISIAISGTLFIIAKPLFTLLFTSKWLFSAELFQLMAIVGFSWPISSLIVSMIEGVGNSKAFLRLEIYKKLVYVPVYVFGFWFGIKGFIYFAIAGSLVAVYLNIKFVSKELVLKVSDQLKILAKYFIFAAVSVAIASLVINFESWEAPIVTIATGLAIFPASFLGLCFLFKMDGVQIIYGAIKKVKIYLDDKRNKAVLTAL